MSDQYRILGPEEIPQRGDERRTKGTNDAWSVIVGKYEMPSGSYTSVEYRRPIPTVAKSATVEEVKNENTIYVPCSVCSHIYHVQSLVEVTCATCWKLRAEKAEAAMKNWQSRATEIEKERDVFWERNNKEHEARLTAERERDEARAKVIGACDVCWTNSWSPSAQNENDSVQLKDGSWARCDMCYMIEGLKKVTQERDEARQVSAKREELYFAAVKERDTLRAENEELKAWKASAISVTPDMQKIGQLLNVPLGESIHDKIIPGIERLREALETLKKMGSVDKLGLQVIASALAGKGEK